MGRPNNLRKNNCAPISSNCITWQGPDIECINLCKGDSISEVTYKLACKLCTLLGMTDPAEYDLSCLSLTKCDLPKDFNELLQLIIDTICSIQESLTAGAEASEAGCPDCEMVVASCFQGSLGAIVQMKDYIAAIGTKVCDQELTIQTQAQAIQELTDRVTALEV
jgi:hypothetical protein